MRKLIWITGVAILAVCLLLVLLKPTRKASVTPKQTNLVNEQSPSQAVESQVLERGTNGSPPALPPTLVSEIPQQRTIEASNAYAQQKLALWQSPIEFYGKVVDENSNAVSDVSIRFRWMEAPDENGERTADTQTDSQGLFSLHGKLGRSLTVWFSKDGYFSSHGGQKGFLYGLAQDVHSPDPQNPVIFNLRKKATPEPLVALKRNYPVRRDGTPLSINLATGETATAENGDLVVRCWTEAQGKRSSRKNGWRCILTVPNGGLVSSDEEFPFMAPESGYKASTEIVMPEDRPDWKSDVDLKLFFRLGDGRHGRMRFSMIAGGQHFCMIDSLLNPTGSRSLEPAEAPQPSSALPPGVRAVIPEFK